MQLKYVILRINLDKMRLYIFQGCRQAESKQNDLFV